MAKKIKWEEEFEKFLFKIDGYSQVVTRIFEKRHKTLKEYTKDTPYKFYINDLTLYSDYKNDDKLFVKFGIAWDYYCYLLENYPRLLKND